MKFTDRFQVTVSKKPKTSDTDTASLTAAPVDYAQIVRETTETVAKYAVVAVGSYVAADTLRQILVKLTPQH